MFLPEFGLGAAFGTDVVEFHIVSPLATDYGRVSGLENLASVRNLLIQVGGTLPYFRM